MNNLPIDQLRGLLFQKRLRRVWVISVRRDFGKTFNPALDL